VAQLVRAYIVVFGSGSRDLELTAGFERIRSCKQQRARCNPVAVFGKAVLGRLVARFPVRDLENGFGVELALVPDPVLVGRSSPQSSMASSHSD
jgi:hypothetical protein